jgi:hypothetical protein
VAEIRLDEKPVQLALWDTAYVTIILLGAVAYLFHSAAVRKNMRYILKHRLAGHIGS